MKPVNIAIAGLGTVGAGTARVLARNRGEIARRAGREIAVTRAAVRDTGRARDCDTDGVAIGGDPLALADDPQVDIVVELMGGESVARDLIMRAIGGGKHVVTANKALIARHGNEIFAAAREAGVMVAFEAAVAGGISIIKAIREGLAGNRVLRVAGIINGTCNFILSGMAERNCSFDEMLAEAGRRGYAEADPSLDIDGVDAAHKIAILAAIAFGIPLRYDAVNREGIRGMSELDMELAADLGFTIKHLGIAARSGRGITIRAHPALVPRRHLIANVDGVMNAILVNGDAVGDTVHYGAGAGAEPTASSVVADIVDVVRALTTDPDNRVPHLAFQPGALADLPVVAREEVETCYYLRLSAMDKPGVLADVTRILAERAISIEAVLQKGRAGDGDGDGGAGGGRVPVVILTHRTREKNVDDALRRIAALDSVDDSPVRMRVEYLE